MSLVRLAAGWQDKTGAIRFPSAFCGKTLVLGSIPQTSEKSPTHRIAIKLQDTNAGPLEVSEMVVPLTGVWEGVTNKGEVYYRIPKLFGDGDGVILRNQFKEADNQPTHRLYISYETAEERETREAGEQGQEREQRRTPHQPQNTAPTRPAPEPNLPPLARGQIHVCIDRVWSAVNFGDILAGDICRTAPPPGYTYHQVQNPVIRGAHRCFEIDEIPAKANPRRPKPEENEIDLTDPFAE